MADKTLVIAPKYEEALPFLNGFAWVKYNGKWGIINENYSYQIVPKYDFVDLFFALSNCAGSVIRVGIKEDYTWGAVIDNLEVIPPIYDSTPIKVAEGVFMVVQNNKRGYITSENIIILNPNDGQNDEGGFSTNGETTWIQKNQSIWNINTKVAFSLNEIFDGFESHIKGTSGFLCFKKITNKYLYGVQNKYSKVILEPIFDNIWQENESYLTIGANNLVGLFTNDFEEVFPIEYQSITYFKDDKYLCKKGKITLFQNLNREQLLLEFLPKTAQISAINKIYQSIEYFDNGYVNYCNFEGKVYFSIPIDNIPSQFVTDNSIIVDGYSHEKAIKAKNQTYIINHENHSFITLHFQIAHIRFFDETYANITDNKGKIFLYNLKTGKNDYPFIIILSTENFYLLTDQKGKNGAMDKTGAITMPLADRFTNEDGMNIDNYHQFFYPEAGMESMFNHQLQYPYWIDVINNIVYADDWHEYEK